MVDEGEARVEFYVDSYSFQGSPYTIYLSFGIAVPEKEQITTLVHLRMSPEHAKVMSILLKRAMKEYEERMGTEITVASPILETHKINLALDW